MEFFQACYELVYFRSSSQAYIEMSVGLILPALFSGFFYVNVIVVLLRRNRDTARNRNLTLAFLVSWLLWLICYVFHYLGATLNVKSKPDNNSLKSNFLFTLYFYRCSFQVLYPHLNVVSFMIVFKPFREWVFSKLRFTLFTSTKMYETSLATHKKLLNWLAFILYGALSLFIICSCFVGSNMGAESRILKLNYMNTFQELSNLRGNRVLSSYNQIWSRGLMLEIWNPCCGK